MNKTRRLVAFIMINILVSAATTLAVLWGWERSHPSITLPTSEGAIMLTLQPALEAAQMIQITLPALDEFTIEVINVIGPGDLEQEVVMVQRAGEGELMLDGWVLADEDGHTYTFAQLSLYKNGAVQIYTRAGPGNSPIERYWGLDDPVWRTGELSAFWIPLATCEQAMSSLENTAIEARLGKLLVQLGLKLALVESCTGGLTSYRVTSVPGSSEYFLGGCVAYSYEAKERVLGVRHETLLEYGAVSRETALEMAKGARKTLSGEVDAQKVIAASITGIAGPGGGMPNKPVGLVWVAISGPRTDAAWEFHFNGDREAVRQAAVEATLEKLLETLNGPH